MVKDVVAVLRHIEIGKTIIVVVAPHATKPVRGPWDASFAGHIGKCAVSIVAIKSVANGNIALVKIAAIYKIDILKTVAIEISDANAGTGFFQDCRYVFFSLEMMKFDAGFAGVIGKLDGCRRRTLRQ